MDFITGFIVFAIVVFIAAVVLGAMAKKQTDFHLVGASRDEAYAVLTDSGVLRGGWKTSNGDGNINIRPGFLLGGRNDRPILSIDLEEDQEGTHVQIWMSAWISKYGMIEPMQSAVLLMRHRKIVKTLRSVCEPQGAAS